VTTLLKNDRIRVVFLNAALLIILASAWVSDKWPDLAPLAISIAVATVIGESLLLYVGARQLAAQNSSIQETAIDKAVGGSEKVDVEQPDFDLVAYNAGELAPSRARYFPAMLHNYSTPHTRAYLFYGRARFLDDNVLLQALRPRASEVSTWALGVLAEKRSLYLAFAKELESRLIKELELCQSLNIKAVAPVTTELAKWQLIKHNDEAFNIVAGSFEIEYFHGRTNIRVLDSSRVTVESRTRGEVSDIAPADLRPSIYQ
jgi:hypothetical protein